MLPGCRVPTVSKSSTARADVAPTTRPPAWKRLCASTAYPAVRRAASAGPAPSRRGLSTKPRKSPGLSAIIRGRRGRSRATTKLGVVPLPPLRSRPRSGARGSMRSSSRRTARSHPRPSLGSSAAEQAARPSSRAASPSSSATPPASPPPGCRPVGATNWTAGSRDRHLARAWPNRRVGHGRRDRRRCCASAAPRDGLSDGPRDCRPAPSMRS